MLGVGLAFAWFAALSLALVVASALERRTRLPRLAGRSGLTPRRAAWGGGVLRPPAEFMLARSLASGARIVRAHTRVAERAHGLRAAARAVACIALASALALVPFAGALGGVAGGLPLVVVDLQHGLAALVVFVLLAALAQVTIGLVEGNLFARLACVRLAGRALALAGSFALVLAPLALAVGSQRLHALVMDQQRDLVLFDAFVWPAWNLFRQPLTALLFVPVMVLLTRRPLALDAIGGGVRLSAFGHDDDPAELYWARSEERLASALFAALFVALFLGAGAIPFVSTGAIVAPLVPFFGDGLPAILGAALEVAVFVAKLVLVLALVAHASRRLAWLRDDQWIRIVTRRILPLAFSNLLLVAGTTLWLETLGRGGP
jgi:NADH:ubiquinone oxidoreductase subunit H